MYKQTQTDVSVCLCTGTIAMTLRKFEFNIVTFGVVHS